MIPAENVNFDFFTFNFFLVIENLIPNTEYILSLSALNFGGSSDEAVANIRTASAGII